MANPHFPKEWRRAWDKLDEILASRRLMASDLGRMVAKATGSTIRQGKAAVRKSRESSVSAYWVVIASVLGLKLRHFFDNEWWEAACNDAYHQWVSGSEVGETTERNRITQAIWTNKLTGEQIDPATATQAQEEKPTPDPTPVKEAPAATPTRQASLNDNKEWVIMRVAAVPSIVELAAQFEVAQKRLKAAAAEHKAAQDALETLRTQLTAAIKA